MFTTIRIQHVHRGLKENLLSKTTVIVPGLLQKSDDSGREETIPNCYNTAS